MLGDVFLQSILTPLLFVCVFISIKASARWINPVTVIAFTFFVPLLFATLRLSLLQAHEWSYETYIAIWFVVGAWLIFPTIVILSKGSPNYLGTINQFSTSSNYIVGYRYVSLVVITCYLISNYIQAKTLIPVLIPDVAYRIHTEFPPVLRLFARCIPVVTGMAYMAFFSKRKWVDFFILTVALLMPLSRLSRIDVILSFSILLILFTHYPIFKFNLKRVVSALLITTILAVAFAELGNLRTNRFGKYEVDYSDIIKWNSSVTGPADILPILYGYFPLSFENFDSFVRQNKEKRTNGTMSFDWLLTGTFKFNRFANLGGLNGLGSFKPISGAANVPTSLHPFYSDFGPIGIFFPAFFYMSIWLFFFYKSQQEVKWLLIYSVYSASFILSSFQALMTASIIYHQLLLTLFLFFICSKAKPTKITGSKK
ncbi:O-antigen polymerase [Methylophilus methylotrophus]|uniref:O-antigen polymerase n=1 Tax=Methylophilus methylotrophus TaxID=17 RepID=UPI000F5935EC|nr:O-antigen polymerase [Methylophilus methylotrophus]